MEALGDGPGMRENGGPIGLRNLGNLCYVNAYELTRGIQASPAAGYDVSDRRWLSI